MIIAVSAIASVIIFILARVNFCLQMDRVCAYLGGIKHLHFGRMLLTGEYPSTLISTPTLRTRKKKKHDYLCHSTLQ